jgi:hypothetical protein
MKSLQQLKSEIQVEAKKGVDFIFAATTLWSVITFIWLLNFPAYSKSVFTFMVGAAMLPLAFGLSKLFRTNWKLENNPLQSLGLWLNFAQLFYFPFLVFFLLKYPDYFIMGYAIITGAHLFPYAWFYNEIGYALAAGLISIGSLFLALFLPASYMFYIPLLTASIFLLLALRLLTSYSNIEPKLKPQPTHS